MARRREIHPDFFIDPKILKLDPLERLFFIGLWCNADRVGVFLDDPDGLAVKILPREPGFNADLALAKLAQLGLVFRYTSQELDRPLALIIHFTRYQRPHPREAKSGLPLPDTYPNHLKKDQGLPKADLGSPRDGNSGRASQASQASQALKELAKTEPPAPIAPDLKIVAGGKEADAAPPKAKGARKARTEKPPDPLHHELLARLVDTFSTVKGAGYAVSQADAKGVQLLLTRSRDLDEHVRRWEICLNWKGYPGSTNIRGFESQWNAFIQPQTVEFEFSRSRRQDPNDGIMRGG